MENITDCTPSYLENITDCTLSYLENITDCTQSCLENITDWTPKLLRCITTTKIHTVSSIAPRLFQSGKDCTYRFPYDAVLIQGRSRFVAVVSVTGVGTAKLGRPGAAKGEKGLGAPQHNITLSYVHDH